MKSFKYTVLATATLLAISSGVVQAAQPVNEIQSLKSTVEELRKQLDELRALIKQRDAAAPVVGEPVVAKDGESQESVEARTAATRAEISGLRADLENYKYDQSRLQERNIPSVTRNTKIGGSVTARYDYQSEPVLPTDSGSTAPAPRGAGFAPLAFGLNFSGNLYRDYDEGKNLTYRLALSGANSAGTTTTSLTDAYLRYSFKPATGNAEDPLGTVTIGQQTVAFGLDAQATDPEVKAVINNALFVSGFGLSARQTGIAIAGDFDPYVDFSNNYRAPLLAYSLGLFNGNGANRGDNNNELDIAGRLVYTLPVDYSSWSRQLQIGGSFYKGSDPLAPANATVATRNGYNNRYGFDINWTHLPYTVTYEVAYSEKDLIAATAKNPEAKQSGRGQYLNFGYTWGEQFLKSATGVAKYDDSWPTSYQAFVRFDEYDANLSGLSLNDKVYATTLGLNVFFAESTKFQINFVNTRNEAPASPALANVNSVAALISASF